MIASKYITIEKYLTAGEATRTAIGLVGMEPRSEVLFARFDGRLAGLSMFQSTDDKRERHSFFGFVICWHCSAFLRLMNVDRLPGKTKIMALINLKVKLNYAAKYRTSCECVGGLRTSEPRIEPG